MQADAAYTNFLNHLLTQISLKKRIFVIDTSDRSLIDMIYKQLRDLCGIDSPAKAFKFSYHIDTSRKVQQQLDLYTQIITNAITLFNYETAAFYMKELRVF